MEDVNLFLDEKIGDFPINPFFTIKILPGSWIK